jgi:glutamate-1-semialdehyde 2,1-aminomutase
VLGLPGLIASRRYAKGAQEKPLTVVYPEGNPGVATVRELIARLWARETFPVTWVELNGGDELRLGRTHVLQAFRVSHGGAQEYFGIKPDMTCLGKVIGGGLPVGAYGGKREIMSLVAPEGPVYQAGTLSGNPLAMTAGIETLKILSRKGTYEKLEEQMVYLEEGLKEASKKAGMKTKFYRAGTMFCTYFTDRDVVDYQTAKTADTAKFARFFQGMLRRGIYLAPSQFEAGFISLAHKKSDLDKTVDAAHETLEEIKK